MMEFPEYAGMSYEQASRKAMHLIERHGWFKSFDRLAALRAIMQRDRPMPDGQTATDRVIEAHTRMCF